jgi:hypothetical protein
MLLLLLFASHVCTALEVTASGSTTIVWSALDSYHKCCKNGSGYLPYHQCKLAANPDIPARAFQDDTGVVRMIVGSTAYSHMSGPSLMNQTRECEVAYNKTADGNPADFAADEYLDSPIAFDNGTVISLVHTEFPGNRYNNSGGPNAPYCTGPGYPDCWTVSVGQVISHDWGATFTHAAPPPHHLVAAVPYGYNQSQPAYGWGDPSNIVKHKDGFYYAALWNRHQVGLQAPGICMIRTNNLLDPASWRAWGGKDYSVSFVDPYTMTPGTDAQHVCTVTNLPAGDVTNGCAAHGLVWSEYLQQYVVTLGCRQSAGAKFRYATSDDLIHWSEAQPLDPLHNLDPQIAKFVVNMNYPTFMDPTAPTAFGDRNFHTIGQNPSLFWVSMGHSPESDGRHLLATPFTFQK